MLACLILMSAPELKTESDQLYARIQSDFWDANRKIYREFWSSDKRENDPAFNWSVGVMLTALNIRAQHDEDAKAVLRDYLKTTEKYWNSRPPVAGFDVLPNPGGVDRYYDDNAWMALALAESSEVLNDPEQLKRGAVALDYALSGEDEKLGGGIYWRESDKASKNTCSNSPTAYACLLFARKHGLKQYREPGLRILKWTLDNLMDPEDKLMWDAKVISDGRIGRDKWTYNAALTIAALAEAERIGVKHEVTPKEMFAAAWKKRRKPGKGMDNPGRFAHMLAEVGLREGYISQSQAEELAWEILKLGKERRFGHDWHRPPGNDQKRFELLDQASVLRWIELVNQAKR